MYSVGGTWWKPFSINQSRDLFWRLDFLAHIAVRDLGAEEDGEDETNSRDDGENDDVLVAGP